MQSKPYKKVLYVKDNDCDVAIENWFTSHSHSLMMILVVVNYVLTSCQWIFQLFCFSENEHNKIYFITE